ncbi:MULTISPECIES: NAD kinase [unclassified Arthrobacter]|uniref:NAD kinase n=1 Tax=unclassified Arthrobacter TaxID=235627 RepID=UPI0021035CF1|nr:MULTISPECIES: NAD kinase [unclassified Arthrobacter]MCQ1946525.1 NAD kinase [Arthrobacter sp. zg-Y1116]MCQ1987339.1 NAD kinase [Arthrobacter sp. zg-Y844]MCQ1996003.1 NAD kinase [Arthrobacter sp. zg-Y1171]UWX82924.1 NAD kinase [Arthrobacter sp. zg-Y1171]
MSRRILVLAHTGRRAAMTAAQEACTQLHSSGLVPVMRRSDLEDIQAEYGVLTAPTEILDEDVALDDVDLGMVLGGDGTILRAAELVRGTSVPLLGVNLGHVGFLAESERADLAQTVHWVVERAYTVEERMTIDVKVWFGGELIARTWALNEAAVEKADRQRMLEVVIEVDARPISSFGCDGVVLATPTGSTAYAFSAGGPVVWPEVEALLLAPISAHALFAKPLVVSPASVLAVEILTRTDAAGVLWCDGRRSVDLPPGARVEVTRSKTPVRLARTHLTPFSERLVRKFQLPTHGWRGPAPVPAAGTQLSPAAGQADPRGNPADGGAAHDRPAARDAAVSDSGGIVE